MDRWTGRVAVVTGASEGIGEAIARRLASHGMKVAALARRTNILEALEKDVKSDSSTKGVLRGYTCDVSDLGQVNEVFSQIVKDLGPVSVLVNNAAIFEYVPLSDMEMSKVRPQIDVNITGVMNCAQQCLESMKKNGINDGHIININSVLGHTDFAMKGIAVYTATKHAITSYTKSLKRELAEDNMKTRVTSLSPGLIKTKMSSWYTDNFPDAPVLVPSDIADSLVYVLSTPINVNIAELTIEPV